MFRFLFLLTLASGSPALYASELFSVAGPVAVTLEGPLKKLSSRRKNELPFMIEVDGERLALQVRKRGNSRLALCRFPPLRLRFTDEPDEATIFRGQDKLKLVTHCQDNHASKTNLLEEYAAYRILNELTPFSYRVQLLNITYVDTTNGKKMMRQGFLIESSEQLARRTGSDEAEVTALSLSSLDTTQIMSVYVFQYLIGNTDFSLVTATGKEHCCHNADLFRQDGKLFYVPYDFDLSGLVNAKYARPDRKLRLKRVTQRRYRGYCGPEEAITSALDTVFAKQGAIEDTISFDSTRASGFLARFFATDREVLLSEFATWCR